MEYRRRQTPRKGLQPSAAPISRRVKLVWAGILLVVYAWIGSRGQFDFSDLMGYYNLQADVFLNGHIYIAQTPSQVFLQDMASFGRHYYLQWGPFPALLHLAAKVAGANLSDRVACILAGWLTSLAFLEIVLLLRKRYSPAVPKWVCGWFFFAFALGAPTAVVPGHQLDAQEAIYRNDLGVMRLAQGHLSEALSQLRRAGELMPNSALIGNNLRLAMELNQAVKP